MSRARCSRRRRPRFGMIAAQFAISLTALTGILAIAVDGGLMLAARRHSQATADAAAMAAASDLYLSRSGTAAQTSAQDIAVSNGFTTSNVQVRLAGSNYLGGPNAVLGVAGSAVPTGYAEVTVTFNQARYFSNVFGRGSVPINARAVARGTRAVFDSHSILVLDTTSKQGALTISGSATLTDSGEVMVNSSNSKAIVVSGSAHLTATNIDVKGGAVGSTGAITGTITTGVTQAIDPLGTSGANIPVPDPATMTVQSNSNLNLTSGSHTLSPGVYTGGIAVNGATVIMQPGVYYMDGGGFKVNNSSSSVTGSGVMIYNNPSSSGDVVNITGGGTISLSPPTSGPYTGISLFQNRTATAPPVISGGSTSSITGTFYFPAAAMTISGSSSAALLGSQYISKDLTLSGSAPLTVTSTPTLIAGKRAINLVE